MIKQGCALFFLIVVMCVLSTGCSTAPETTEEVLQKADIRLKPSTEEKFTEKQFTRTIQQEAVEEKIEDYKVGPNDSLSIAVYGEEDLSLDGIIVSSEGMITYPLIGRISVEGLTAHEVSKKIAALLSDGYLVNPQVTTTVKVFKSKRVFILGAVEEPGVIPLQGHERLLEIISSAGGIRSEEAGKFILIWRQGIRDNEGKKAEDRLIKVEVERLLQQGDMRLNVPLENKDVVFVPQAEYVYIIGEVKDPGSYKIYDKDITILEAITMAGGFSAIASPNKTRVIRVEDGVERTINVPMKDIIKGEKSKDIYLKSGDIIVVPESLF
jgi:polysaccharide export outer membrane protein